MTSATLPPLALDSPLPRTGERLLRWALVAGLHGALLYGALDLAVRPEALPLLPSMSVRLLPVQEAAKPETAPPPPRPAPPLRRAAPSAAPPVLAARAPEAPASFVTAPQPPAAAPATEPIAAVASTPAAPAPVTAARFDADYLHNPKPVYPPFSRRNGEEGKVLLRVRVSAEGTSLESEIRQSSGFPRLDGAAREAVAKWRFVPARRGDEAIESWVTVPINFSLE